MKTGFIGGKFLPLHLGHVNAIVKASCMVDKLYIVLSHSKNRDQYLCEKGNIKYMPFKVRLSWLKRLAQDMENVEVIDVEDNYYEDDYNWEEGAQIIKRKIGTKIDCVFSSEEIYSNIFARLYPNAKHIIIDSQRKNVPISATKIRTEGVYKNWEFLPEFVREYFVKKIVVVGTESCGKSTLIKNLSKIFNTTYVHEFGREMCEIKGGSEALVKEDYPYIAYGQKMLEFEAIKHANKVLFIDTESLVTKYYLQLYEDVDNVSLFDEISKLNDYDLWIFLEPDVKWVDDGTRMHGNDEVRFRNNKILKKILDETGIDYVTIGGDYKQRFDRSINLVEKILV